MKKSLLALAALLLLALLAIVAYYGVFSKTSIAPINTTYASDKYGFEFSYPTNADIVVIDSSNAETYGQVGQENSFDVLYGPSQIGVVSIFAYPMTGSSLEDAYLALVSDGKSDGNEVVSGSAYTKISTTSLGNLPALLVQSRGYGEATGETSKLILAAGNGYYFTLYPQCIYDSKPQCETAGQVGRAILSSFRLRP